MTFKVYNTDSHVVLYDGPDQSAAMRVIEKTGGNVEFRTVMPSPGHISQKVRGTTSQGCIVVSQTYQDGAVKETTSMAFSDRDLEKLVEAQSQ